jgi:hypothetical protein
MVIQGQPVDGEGIRALKRAAQAFERSKQLGLVWLGEDGMLETHEGFDAFMPNAPANPDQLRLGD